MFRVTHFRKTLAIERSKPFGSIRIYYGNPIKHYDFPLLSLTKFMALSHILENDPVDYDPEKKILFTPQEPTHQENPIL